MVELVTLEKTAILRSKQQYSKQIQLLFMVEFFGSDKALLT